MRPLWGSESEHGRKEQPAAVAWTVARTDAGRLQVLAKQQERMEMTVGESQMPRLLRLLKLMAGLMAVALLCGIMKGMGQGGLSLRDAFGNAPQLFYLMVFAAVLWAVLYLIELRRTRKLQNDPEYLTTAQRTADAAQACLEALDVPQNAVELEVFFLPCQREGKTYAPMIANASFCNVPILAFRQEEVLYLADTEHKIAIPLSEITALRRVKGALPLPSWHKEDLSEKDAARHWHLTRGNEAMTTTDFLWLEAQRDGEVYALWLPPYEEETICRLTGLTVTDAGSLAALLGQEDSGDDRIRPHFSLRPTRPMSQLFSSSADMDFKVRHPKAYPVITVILLVALFAPMLLYMALVVPGASNSPHLLLGMVGAFLVGAGLSSVVAAWMDQYLGHIFTGICMVLGTVLIAAAQVLMG